MKRTNFLVLFAAVGFSLVLLFRGLKEDKILSDNIEGYSPRQEADTGQPIDTDITWDQEPPSLKAGRPAEIDAKKEESGAVEPAVIPDEYLYGRLTREYGEYLDALILPEQQRERLLKRLAEFERHKLAVRQSIMRKSREGSLTFEDLKENSREVLDHRLENIISDVLHPEQIDGLIAFKMEKDRQEVLANLELIIQTEFPGLLEGNRKRLAKAILNESLLSTSPMSQNADVNMEEMLSYVRNRLDNVQTSLVGTMSQEQMQVVIEYLDYHFATTKIRYQQTMK